MQSKLVGAVGVLSAFVTLDVSQATASNASEATQFLKPQSFAELLEPVPNALALLSAVDEAQSMQRKANPRLAQYYPYYHHHHHHHHHHHGWGPDYDEGYAYRAQSYGYDNGYGGGSAHDRRMQIIWCTQHPGRC